MSRQYSGKKVVLVGHIYENIEDVSKRGEKKGSSARELMGEFLPSIPKDLRREIKFESEEQGINKEML